MKSLPFKIPETGETSFRVQVDEVSHFYDRFHQHPELQITLIVKSYGTLFIGDRILPFEEGDLFVIGPDIPHVFKNESLFYKDEASFAKSISLFFNETSFGERFFQLPELKEINILIQDAEKGIRMKGTDKAMIAEKIKAIAEVEGFLRLLKLFEILQELSVSREKELLSSMNISKPRNDLRGEKINQVFQFIVENYDRPIQLEEAASVANLSVSAFCRFFKLQTRKTFTRFVNELRISKACKMLMEEELSISEICYEAGFNNLSNFNRQFKKGTGITPRDYLTRHRQG